MTDQSIVDFPENTDPQADDLLVMVNDPSGSPTTEKITVENFMLDTEDVIPSVRVYKSGVQGIPATTWTIVTFDTESYDTDSMHDTVTNNERIVCQRAGKYHVFAQLRYAAGTGWRTMALYNQDGDDVSWVFSTTSWGGNPTYLHASLVLDMAVGDYVYMRTYSTGAYNADSGENGTYLGMTRIGD